jgi:hypothetical protein
VGVSPDQHWVTRYPDTLVYHYPMTDAPNNLAELRAIKDPLRLIAAADAYIDAREKAIKDARQMRDDAIGKLAVEHGIAKAARMIEKSPSTVKNLKRAYEAAHPGK